VEEDRIMTSDETDYQDNSEVHGTATDWQRKRALFLFAITTIFLFADQNLLAPNLSQAAKEFGFDDIERDDKLGVHIAVAFFSSRGPRIIYRWVCR